MKKKFERPHMGALLKRRIKEHGFTDVAVAKGIGRASTTVNAYYNYESVQAKTLWEISNVINYNILAELGELNGVPYKHAALETTIEDLQTQLVQRDLRIVDLEKELAIYKSIVQR